MDIKFLNIPLPVEVFDEKKKLSGITWKEIIFAGIEALKNDKNESN